MSGETHLPTLLAELEPALLPGELVFLSVPGAGYGDLPELRPVALMVEDEGLSLVVPRAAAEAAGRDASAPLRCITLRVHSSLEAVGLTAAVARALAEVGISANVIAAAHHDHVFVPAADAERALAALAALSRRAAGGLR